MTDMAKRTKGPGHAIPDYLGMYPGGTTWIDADEECEPARNTEATRQPDRAAARRALSEIYGNAIPDAAALPNGELCQVVREKLPAQRKNISNDTILRAAGRR